MVCLVFSMLCARLLGRVMMPRPTGADPGGGGAVVNRVTSHPPLKLQIFLIVSVYMFHIALKLVLIVTII